MPLKDDSLCRPACCVLVAGFQNIADSEPPAATPAKDDPCPQALCSRTANPPAFASAVAASNTPTPLHANRTAFKPRNDITQPPIVAAPSPIDAGWEHRAPGVGRRQWPAAK